MRVRRFLTGIFLATMALAAHATIDRPFPTNAKRGMMTPGMHPAIVIDGKQRNLSPGARIWNQENLMELPQSLRGSDHVVNYTEDMSGDINRVWILTRDEARKALPKPQPNPN